MNKAQIDNKANTPEMIRVQNGNISPTTKYTDILKAFKQKNLNQPSKVPNTNRPTKSYSIVVEFDQTKNRTSSQFKQPKEITPTKKQNQPTMPQSQRLTIKNQVLTTQQKITQEKSKINSKHPDVNKLDQRIKTQQNERYKEEQKNIQKMLLKKANPKKDTNTKPQLEKHPQLMSTRQIPSRQSFSPTTQIAKTANTTRGHSPSSYQSDNQNGKLQAILTVIRPIFKEAKYYQTSVVHFLREEFFPNTSPYQVQFKIEFQEQKDYFKTKFCDHFNLTFNSLKHCSQLSSQKPLTTKLLNPPKKPHFSSDTVKTLVFDLDETLIHCNDINNNSTDHTTVIHIPNEPETEIRFNIRPHCQQMLKALSQYYELILFTASYKEYADKILEYIDPKGNLFSYRFYRESCLELEEGLLVKDLRVIEGRKLENMAIIDNSAYCYIYQLENGIPIIPFEENKKDKELLFMADYFIKCEKQLNWLQHHKLHFQNQLYLQCSTIEECIQRLLQSQNY
ncbi:unnamed protein product (macronuclear) [Paramecium tetraurelia]|uniref:FCP1 homology domain-containing protein n=1 Tax=Paramecium tetraurelia TaxID=5888 RepID=A0CPA8_PARTE|nr:uncharacterized protein GSPATT00009016001 [Paramecium tetraurelia]CAK72625.1 unnamed protein product [Paramecium tetraurelia]|eukprot:XP_001440022.1 hypothetical protein (macronuclear) [Paramecium tetraurelia strain d4-2]